MADSAPATACAYSAAGEPCSACTYSATVSQQGAFLAPPSLAVFTQGSSRLSNNLPLILLLTLVPLHADHLLQLRESKTSERLGEIGRASCRERVFGRV